MLKRSSTSLRKASATAGRISAQAEAQAWFRLGQIRQRQGEPKAALDCLDRAIALRPAHAGAWSQRGSLLEALGRRAEATAAFERAIALGADADLHRFFIAALDGGGAAPAAPRAYVQGLFDDYADSFDRHLVDVLGYRGHEQLVAPLAGLQAGGFDAALDLGCGTGLCGPLLRPLVRRLEGLDLSPAMLERAAARGALFDFIERWYNRERRHSALGYQSPSAYEAAAHRAA